MTASSNLPPTSQPTSAASHPSIAATGQPWPLLGQRDLDAPFAWRDGQAISTRGFLRDVQRAAAALPASAGSVVCLCADRYEFVVIFAAALVKRLPTLMPPNAMASTLALLRREHPTMHIVESLSALLGSTVIGASDTSDAAVPLIDPDFDAAVLLTSGSTGAPVPHARNWRSVTLNAQAQAERMADVLSRPDLKGLTLVATVPGQHSYGFESSVTLAMLGGATLDAGRPFYPADIVDALARVPRPRALVTTPFHLKTLLASGVKQVPVEVIFSATAPLSPQLAAQAEAALGGPLFEVYGCTEAGQVATRHTTASPTWTTYGELQIHRRHDGNTADDAESYWVEGGHVFSPTQLADVLELDDPRQFRLLGRRGDLIHVAGKRSSLAHLNHHLNSIPGVDDGAFYLPEEQGDGSVVRPIAFVVAPSLTAAEVSRALHQRLDAVFVPRRIVMLEAIAHEGTGKITVATLRALAREHGVA